jgi:uncharacterized protein YndB with AHSA1/START domain
VAAFTDELRIDAPAGTVFDLLADARNELRWNDGVSRVELLTDEPIGQGSRFLVEDRRGEHAVTIAVFDRPERIEWALTGERMDVAIRYAFMETAGGTTVVGTFEARPKGFTKVLLPLLMPLIKRDIAKQHGNFKSLCEARAS